jgi:curved DNA-binding protein CbpA
MLTLEAGGHKTNNNNDPYEVLGVTAGASQSTSKQNYREICLKYHPDKNTHRSKQEQVRSEQQFKELQSALALIGDPDAWRE